jgi:tetratricopeptide (TPR) repeat protein
LTTFQLAGPGDAKKNGRKGNSQYTQEQYSEAITSYQNGVRSVQEEGPGAVHSGLLNNLGAALFRSGDSEQAEIAFSSAARMANTPQDLVRASYNAGNAAFTAQELETALENYRRALLSDPSNLDAKFNYEFVKRQLDQQEQNGEGGDESEEQNEDQQGENQENQENQDQQQEPQEREDPTKLSEEEAQRILQALENDEQQLLRQVQKMKTRPRRVEKDW